MQWFTALEDAKKSGFFLNKDEGPSQQVQNLKNSKHYSACPLVA